MDCPNCKSPHTSPVGDSARTCNYCLHQFSISVPIIDTPIANFPIPATPPLAPTPMSPQHPQWQEFCTLMRGPRGCNISQGRDGKFNGVCNGAAARPIARRILAQFPGVDVDESMMKFHQMGGFCDCRIAIGVCK